jgi:hypothetical protein
MDFIIISIELYFERRYQRKMMGRICEMVGDSV